MALHYAALYGTSDEVRGLLAADADVSATDKQGVTALHVARQQNRADVAELLLEAGAPIDACDQWGYGNTPLWRAVFNAIQRPPDPPRRIALETDVRPFCPSAWEDPAVPLTFLKRRDPPLPGSIPDRLQMFTREVRFYVEVAPTVGIRVPEVIRAEMQEGSTLLELEDLSHWREGAEPVAAAKALASLHGQWVNRAEDIWPWLPRPDAADLVGNLFDARWPSLRERSDLTPVARRLGDALLGEVDHVERAANAAGPHTLTHGDASAPNMRTSPNGEVAFLDWEDVGSGPGICDMAWFLVSSVEPSDWDQAIDAYGDASGLTAALPAVSIQAFLSLSHDEEGSADAREWVGCLEAVHARL